jgi:hypothetical protein
MRNWFPPNKYPPASVNLRRYSCFEQARGCGLRLRFKKLANSDKFGRGGDTELRGWEAGAAKLTLRNLEKCRAGPVRLAGDAPKHRT